MTKTVIFPVTRIHEPLSMEVEIENNTIVDARLAGMLFRGFESIMKNRKALDAPLFTQRICGICSSAHAIASTKALESVWKLEVTQPGKILRNLVFAADILQNHIRHFYLFVLTDYFYGPEIPPFIPASKEYFILPEKLNKEVIEHYFKGIEAARICHEVMAIIGGKTPHQHVIYPTGVSTEINTDKISKISAKLDFLEQFITTIYAEDVAIIEHYYPEYNLVAKGCNNFLCFGMLDEYPSGVVLNNNFEHVDTKHITEEVTYSWYKDKTTSVEEGKFDPKPEKEKGYSWVTSPRYKGLVVEGGSLARRIIKERKLIEPSVLERIRSRQLETLHIVKAMKQWLELLNSKAKGYSDFEPKGKGVGYGLTDAMRGPLGHWVQADNDVIKNYNIITPSTWNFSPKDAKGQKGAVEQALIGVKVMDENYPFEAGRVIHSFDPCLSCAIHLARVKDKKEPVLVV